MLAQRKPRHIDPIGQNVQLDEAILAKLPADCKVLSVTPSGKSLWVPTVKILVSQPDGQTIEYFKKGATGKAGEDMIKRAFEADQALYAFVPDHMPKPFAYGTYADHPDTHFYISEFVEMSDDFPSPQDWQLL
ncbi:hypothetical protein BDV19DRAFT_385796 [Aspergillus venezuelensis]